jgi:glycosyltransferase involved in cell wall biosynthesis
MNETGLPRVLFVAPNAFNASTGAGVTFSNLFHGWPKDRLATAHNDPVPTTDDVCAQYFVLSHAEVRRRWPFHWAATAVASRDAANGTASSAASRWARRIKQRVFGDGLPEIAAISPALARFIDAFRPQLLYTILGGAGIVDLVDQIRTRWRLPLVVHVMDDWRDSVYGHGWLSGWQRRRLNQRIDALIRLARARIGICDTMAEAFAREYGVPFAAFQNAVDSAQWPAARQDMTPTDTPRLLYSGSMLPFAQVEAVVETAQAVAALAAEGMPIHFDIHCPPAQAAACRDQLALGPSVRVLPPFARWTDYIASMAAADALLLPVSFDPVSRRFVRYSMPTKVPEYLMSGTPVLVYGPAGVAQVEYARRDGWGHVIPRQDRSALVDGLRRIMSDMSLRRELSARARATATERHDAVAVRTGFRRLIVDAAA